LAVQCAGAADPWSASPEDRTLVDGVYTNPYFILTYPLPPGWKSASAFLYRLYVLSTPAPAEGTKATILITAQDAFFAGKSVDDAVDDAMGMAKNLAHNIFEPDRAALQPSMATIAGNSFARSNSRITCSHASFSLPTSDAMC
jgi:hypothetical protein